MKLFIFFLLLSSRLSAYEWEVSACCIFQNEARFLKEWVEYHQLVGIEHFFMYDNQSTDNPRQVLKAYIDEGIVEYIDWDKSYDTPEGWWHVQRGAYLDAVGRASTKSKWLCVIDTDEFIVPLKDDSIQMFLKDYEEFGGVCINWVFYGTSNIQRIPEGTWMISQLLRRTELKYSGNHTVKSIIRPERIDKKRSSFPHICAYKPPYYHVNVNKEQIKKGSSCEPCHDRIRLHHYWCRDVDFMLNDKYPRNERWYGKEKATNKIKEEAKMNECYDPVILEVISKLLYRKLYSSKG
jgi:hypothetical protein